MFKNPKRLETFLFEDIFLIRQSLFERYFCGKSLLAWDLFTQTPSKGSVNTSHKTATRD